jgi:hypothetical protein
MCVTVHNVNIFLLNFKNENRESERIINLNSVEHRAKFIEEKYQSQVIIRSRLLKKPVCSQWRKDRVK